MGPIEQYIRQAAQARGINPDVAVRVAKAEGGLKDPTRQSLVTKNGRREPSYGPFQLLIGGGGSGFPEGMGNRALAAGIDPRDPNQWQKGVDFALDNARKSGWGQWYGAKAAGLGNWAGINGGAVPGGVPLPGKIGGDSMVARNFDPQVAAATNTPVMGAMSPMSSDPAGLTLDPDAAALASGQQPATFGDRLQAAGKHFSDAFQPPKPVAPPMPKGNPNADALLKLLQNPQALAQMFAQQRLR